MNPKLSVLDLAPVFEGHTPRDSFHNSHKLVQKAEQFGYTRYWVAEHHSMEGVASSATAVLIGYLAAATKKIRVGAGGIMLPNHAPLVVAEQFGTLESMYPNRIDLGLGRAPGTDQMTARALRRDEQGAFDFETLVNELFDFFEDRNPYVKAVPGGGLNIPVWLLGSSLYSAKLAGEYGLPYAFASHFAPDLLDDAIRIYYRHFTPSKHLEKPYVIASINAFVGETDEEGEYLASTLFHQFLNITRGKRGKSPLPTNMDEVWTEYEKRNVLNILRYTYFGSKDKVKQGIEQFLEDRPIDEIMINSPIYDLNKRISSYQYLSEIFLV